MALFGTGQIALRPRRGRRPSYLKRAKRRRLPAELLAVPILALGLVAMSGLPRLALATQRIEGAATRIVDGDTLYLSGIETRIRLWGLDAPERGAPGGAEATRVLREIAQGKRLSCKQVDIDRYGRIVGQCFLPGGEDVAALMIQRGAAQEYFRYSGGYYSVKSLVAPSGE